MPTPPSPPAGHDPAARIAPRAGYWRFGHYTLDVAHRELEHGGHRVRLDQRTLAVLECLLEHADTVVAREALIAQAWRRQPVADSAVSKAIRRLRIALGADAGKVLVTVYGVGYKLALPAVREGFDAVGQAGPPAAARLPAADVAPRQAPAPTPPGHVRARRSWGSRATRTRAGIVAAIVGAVAAAWVLARFLDASAADL